MPFEGEPITRHDLENVASDLGAQAAVDVGVIGALYWLDASDLADRTGIGVAVGRVAVKLLVVVDGDLGHEAMGCDQRGEESEKSEASGGSHHCKSVRSLGVVEELERVK